MVVEALTQLGPKVAFQLAELGSTAQGRSDTVCERTKIGSVGQVSCIQRTSCICSNIVLRAAW